MAFQGYPENQTYKPITEAAFNLGQTVRAAKQATAAASPRPTVPQYPNVADAVQTSGATTSQPLPEVLSKLGTMTTPYLGTTKFEPSGHLGVDIANKFGTPIPSLTGGEVVESGNAGGFGRSVVIRDQQGNLLRYSHLYQNFVPVGTKVTSGQQIGTMGYSGSTYSRNQPNNPVAGTHLDLRIKSAANKYLNPLTYNYQ